MSIMDKNLVFSDCQTFAFTDLTTQAASTNLVDLGAEDLQIGNGTPLYLNIRCAESFTTTLGSTGYVVFKLDNDTGSTFVDTGPSLIEKKMNIAELIIVGSANRWILRQALPHGKIKRYLRLVYVRGLDASTGFSTGGLHFDSWISSAVPDRDVGT